MHSLPAIAMRGSRRIPKMKRLLLIGVAACGFAAIPNLSASAMPLVAANALIVGSDNPVILARSGHGHGGGDMGRGGRGHHYGWGRGRHRGRH
ncbi:hypothetical protein [Bradyrhizobium erythrophlei]|uniref:Uncharacterized protein n=1 Tax=Bradyrhizobium erythrophlei TaxID=1437360 RepID=A0A1H4YFS1_9BRAD|nr:hypothetical protein [Bradyrhizobium erythrophlei]SED16812.1 hypothetical protein SAMN05444164_3932 [Bradyrhizobium erythrophlei]